MKKFKNNKLVLCLFAVLFIIIVIGIISANLAKSSLDNSKKENISSISSTYTEADDDNSEGYKLYSLDFINKNCGWAIKDVYNSHTDTEVTKVVSTKDGGAHWSEYDVGGAKLKQFMFADEENGWAIAEAGNKVVSEGDPVTDEILYSNDGGVSWKVQLQVNVESSKNFDMGFWDSKHACVIICGTMYKTEDGGNSWSEVTFPINNFTAQHVSFCNTEKGWVSGIVKKVSKENSNNKPADYTLLVLYTTDAGESWQTQFKNDYGESWNESLDINFINAKIGWFLTCNYDTTDGELYYTADGGQNWKMINQLRCNRPSPTELCFITPLIGWIPLDVGAGGLDGGFFYTEDGGKHFRFIQDENGIADVEGVEFVSQKEGWATINNYTMKGYIAHTTDGGTTWNKVYP